MSETTRLICAHCAHDNPVSNSYLFRSDKPMTTLVLHNYNNTLTLHFKCQNKACGAEYSLPFVDMTINNDVHLKLEKLSG